MPDDHDLVDNNNPDDNNPDDNNLDGCYCATGGNLRGRVVSAVSMRPPR